MYELNRDKYVQLDVFFYILSRCKTLWSRSAVEAVHVDHVDRWKTEKAC